MSDMDGLMDRIDEQLKSKAGYNPEISNVIRERINSTISAAISEASASGEDLKLDKLSKDIQNQLAKEGINTTKAFGSWNPQTVMTLVNTMGYNIYKSQKEVRKVEEQFKGLISDATEVNNLLGGTGDIDDDGGGGYTPTPEGTDKKSKNNPALDDIERRQKEETTALIKAYAERTKTKEEYEKGLQEIELKYLNEKFALAGLDSDKRAEIEKAYYDFKAKLREKEDADEAKRVADAEKQRQELEKWNEKETEAKVAAAISDIDMQAESEQIALMDKYASKLISEQEYQDKLLAIEQDALAKKLRINGLSENQMQQLRKQSLTKQISE